jgi:hypothetical protein
MSDARRKACLSPVVGAPPPAVAALHTSRPDFRLEREIKNEVTVVAKTTSYWQEHIAGAASPRE